MSVTLVVFQSPMFWLKDFAEKIVRRKE